MQLGFIGLGAMGGHFARNLVRAGWPVLGFDVSGARMAEAKAAGVAPAATPRGVVDAAEVVLTSLPSSEAWVHLARTELVPGARAGQLFIDVGTVAAPETRRVAAELGERGAALVDAPLSGGPRGAESGSCFVFAGGDREAFERARPILEVFGGGAGGGRLTYCGPSGNGQVAKGVNQLAMGLGAAAYLEAVAFGVNAGVDADVLAEAVGDDTGWRAMVRSTARRIAAGQGDDIGVKFRELPYFLQEADWSEFPLPLTELLYALCDRGERVTVDDNRPAPSFFRELIRL
ncbi:MAG TPA: NAD(P)-dependent oxidoreductase [Chloroflexota bacterium]|nr:NAD(P)-dependent oxidoreductase [Chloroflexota bacterium]